MPAPPLRTRLGSGCQATPSRGAGQKRIPPEVAAELAEHATEDELTSREIAVLRLIATGNTTK